MERPASRRASRRTPRPCRDRRVDRTRRRGSAHALAIGARTGPRITTSPPRRQASTRRRTRRRRQQHAVGLAQAERGPGVRAGRVCRPAAAPARARARRGRAPRRRRARPARSRAQERTAPCSASAVAEPGQELAAKSRSNDVTAIVAGSGSSRGTGPALLKLAAQLAHQREREAGLVREQRGEVRARHPQQLAVAAGPHRGRAGRPRERRQLSHDRSPREHARDPGRLLEHDLQPAGAHDVQAVARISLAKQPLARLHVHDRGSRCDLCRSRSERPARIGTARRNSAFATMYPSRPTGRAYGESGPRDGRVESAPRPTGAR